MAGEVPGREAKGRRQVKGSSRVMERRQTGAKSIDPAMRGRGGRCRGESRSLGMGGKRKQVETKDYYTVQAQTKAEESTRSVWTAAEGTRRWVSEPDGHVYP